MTSAVLLHLVLVLALLLGPRLLAQPEPREFVAVEIVSIASLPTRRAPAPPPVVDPPPPEIRIEPPKPAPPAEALTLPAPTKKPQPKSPPPSSTPAPEAVNETAPAVAPGPLAPGSSVVSDGPVTLGLDPDFTFGYYVDRLRSAIRQQWHRPPVGGEVEVILYFRIQKDGSVSELNVFQSSGRDSFDRAGLKAVESASPLPPLPRGYRRPSLGVRLVLR